MFKRLVLMAAVATLLGVSSASAQAPKQLTPAASNNNALLAQAVASKLTNSGKLSGYSLDVVANDGKVQLIGKVASSAQADAAVALAKEVAGVTEVTNSLAAPGVIAQSSMQEPAPMAGNEPVPSFHAGMAMGGQANMSAPPTPPYAWPSYAPYNNFSRVGYPNTYPAGAMPYIGPINPFPRAPLGWRNVTLSFDDGIWYLSSHAGNRDWWSIRYW